MEGVPDRGVALSAAAAGSGEQSAGRVLMLRHKSRLMRRHRFRSAGGQWLLAVAALPALLAFVGAGYISSRQRAALDQHEVVELTSADGWSAVDSARRQLLGSDPPSLPPSPLLPPSPPLPPPPPPPSSPDGLYSNPMTPDPVFTMEQMRQGAVILHILCLLYMFVGIAIVCDEYFVSSLELISEFFKISDDVAGATFMAAGGSAPEFATNMFGTLVFTSDVGFGTIVGSAVFNILFVIGLCAYFSGFPTLQLTWYPLLRDSSFYVMSLVVLVCLVVDLEVTWPDALVLILLYLLYVVIMKFDPQIKACITNFEAKHVRLSGRMSTKVNPSEPATTTAAAKAPEVAAPAAPSAGMDRWQRLGQVKAYELGGLAAEGQSGQAEGDAGAAPSNGSEYTEGAGGSGGGKDSILKKWDETIDAARSTAVADGVITNSSMIMSSRPVEQSQFKRGQAKTPVPPSKLQSKMSLAQLANQSQTGQEQTKAEAPAIAVEVEAPPKKDGDDDNDDDDDEPTQQCPEIPDGWLARFKFLICAPLLYLFALTIPDCRLAKFRSCFGFTFTMSIVWITILSYVMVWMAEEISATLGIPSSIAGVTILAAGTSIPDAISSVIVAREGHGDMALSSSIGSNVFDITFGLPVPWLIKTAFLGGDISIQSRSIPIQVSTLIAMVVVVVVTIHLFHWNISKPMGIAWFILYFFFLIFSIVLELGYII